MSADLSVCLCAGALCSVLWAHGVLQTLTPDLFDKICQTLEIKPLGEFKPHVSPLSCAQLLPAHGVVTCDECKMHVGCIVFNWLFGSTLGLRLKALLLGLWPVVIAPGCRLRRLPS